MYMYNTIFNAQSHHKYKKITLNNYASKRKYKNK